MSNERPGPDFLRSARQAERNWLYELHVNWFVRLSALFATASGVLADPDAPAPAAAVVSAAAAASLPALSEVLRCRRLLVPPIGANSAAKGKPIGRVKPGGPMRQWNSGPSDSEMFRGRLLLMGMFRRNAVRGGRLVERSSSGGGGDRTRLRAEARWNSSSQTVRSTSTEATVRSSSASSFDAVELVPVESATPTWPSTVSNSTRPSALGPPARRASCSHQHQHQQPAAPAAARRTGTAPPSRRSRHAARPS